MVPPYETNHASFIELLPNGDLLLSWFSGKKEGYSGVAIVLSRLKNGSDQWTNAAVVAKRDGYSNQNPVLFYDSQGKMVHLYYAQNPGIHSFMAQCCTLLVYAKSYIIGIQMES